MVSSLDKNKFVSSVNMTGFIKELKKAYSRSNHYAQLGNALQKHFFASSALIMGNLKGSNNRFFNFSAQNQNFTGGPNGTDLP